MPERKLIGHFRYREHEFKTYVEVNDIDAKIILHEVSNFYYDIETDSFDTHRLLDEEFIGEIEDGLTEYFFQENRSKIIKGDFKNIEL